MENRRYFLYQDIDISSVAELLSLSRAFSANASLATFSVRLALRLPKDCFNMANEASQEGESMAALLTDLLANATRLQHLTISQQRWGLVEQALLSAGFSESLQTLSLKGLIISAADLPLKSLAENHRFPNLKELRLSEEQEADLSLQYLNLEDDISGPSSDLSIINQVPIVWADMQVVINRRLGWSIDAVWNQMPRLGGSVAQLSLIVPANIISAGAHSFGSILPQLRTLNVKPVGEQIPAQVGSSADSAVGDACSLVDLCASLFVILQATCRLESFALTALYIPADLFAHLPITLLYLALRGCGMEDDPQDPQALALRSLCDHILAGTLPRLITLSYEPKTKIIPTLHEVNCRMHYYSSDFDLLALGLDYLELFANLKVRCQNRSIKLNSKVHGDLLTQYRTLRGELEDLPSDYFDWEDGF